MWLGLFEPSLEELQKVQARFGLHDLAIEDAQNLHLRPKVEQYSEGAITFLVIRTARYIDETDDVEFGEVSVFVGDHFVITVRQGGASELHEARTRLEQRPDLLAEGPDAALWAIMDKIVDDYAPVVQDLDRDITELEETVFTGSVAPSERIYKLRREATELYRAVHPLLGAARRDRARRPAERQHQAAPVLPRHQRSPEAHGGGDRLAARAARGDAPGEPRRDLASAERDQRPPERDLKAADPDRDDLPLTFITGFFGMNFEWLTGHDTSLTTFLIWGIGTLIVSLIALGIYFKRRGWFGREDAT